MKHRSYWEATQKILLVTNFNSVDEIHAFRAAIKNVQLNVNDCVILAIVSTKKEKLPLSDIHSVVYLSPQEINFLGRWKNEPAVKALSRFYDTLILNGDISPKVLKSVKRVKNTISVGINTNNDFLTVKLSTEQSAPEHLLNFVKQTLEKIL